MVLYYPSMYGYYGYPLYSTPRADDIERRYRNTLSRTHLRSDRGDLGLYTFAGSHLHGGTPAAEKIYPVKSKASSTYDLYAPLGDVLYGRGGYYDYLRSTSPEPRKRYSIYSPYYGEPYYYYTHHPKATYDAEYKTSPTKIYTDYDSDLKKSTTKTTTRTETWMPLTTYIYSTPYHSYYYKATPFSSYTYRTADDLYSYDFLNDYRYFTKRTTRTTSKNIDDLSYSSYMDKCSKIQSQLNEVSRCVSEAESKVKNEISTSRSRMQVDLADLASFVDDTARYNDDIYKAIRKQGKQISALNSLYQNINRNIAEVADSLEKSRTQCQNLQSELNSVHSSLEMAYKRIIIV